MRQPVRVFFSYAHEDDKHRFELEKHLKRLERDGLVASWHDRKLLPGENWQESIDRELSRAEVVLFLLSSDFLASEYIWGVEVRQALEQAKEGRTLIIPVFVRACDWEGIPLASFQGLPLDGTPVTSSPNQDEAWTEVAKGLRHLIETRAPGAWPQSGPARAPISTAPDPTRYLEALDTRTSYVELRGMGAKVAERLPLEQVYTRLRVAAAREGRRSKKGEVSEEELQERLHGERDLSLAEVLRGNPSAVIIGDPGSGKTTFLRFAAQRLARAHLSGDAKDVANDLGIDGNPPFPIFARLTEMAEYLREQPNPSIPADAPEHLLRYLDFTLQGHGYELPERYLRDRLHQGGCFLLLDGLDEVPATQREQMGRIVEHFVAEGNGDNRLLLTCRTRAYEGKASLGTLPAFPLADFGPQQVEQFIRYWCRALHRLPRDADPKSPEAEEAEKYRSALQETVGSHPNVGPLTANPLMLTMLAVVHWTRRQLPEERAELYQVAVDYLMESRKELSQYPAQIRQEALQALALAMFEDPGGLKRTYGLAGAAAVVGVVLGLDDTKARDFLERETLHSGLLVSHTDGEVEFWHLTFQEYLAALQLSSEDDWWQRIQSRLYLDQWNEVVLLLGSCLRKKNGVQGAQELIERILSGAGGEKLGWRVLTRDVRQVLRGLRRRFAGHDRLRSRALAVGLVGRLLRDLRPYGGDPAAATSYDRDLRETLAIFEPPAQGEAIVSEAIRNEVGEALGQAGDPRLQDESRLRVRLEGGTFLMGAQARDRNAPGHDEEAFDFEGPVRRVTLSPFDIGRYPVTVAQYQKFVESGEAGYLDPHTWDPKGWAWRENEKVSEPAGWAGQLRHRNRPVVGVSWYEADAYCRWIGGSLPTEAQWEFAARGEEGRKYPWGNEPAPTEAHANFDGRMTAPTPVGAYPLGPTPEGIHDLAGNVWEWCSDWWENPRTGDDLVDPPGPSSGTSRVVRGGSFGVGYPRALRGAVRDDAHPENRHESLGFRVVFVVA